MATDEDEQIEKAEKEWLELWQRGPVRTRWEGIPLQVGDSAPDFELADSSGKNVRLSDFWGNGPALLLFWRHYGCSCGMRRAERLVSEYVDYVKLGGTVVVIGQGEPERATKYAAKHNIPCTVLCDPTFKVYEAYDLLEGQPSQVFFDASDELLRCEPEAGREFAKSRQKTDRALVDSPWLLPGEFVVDKSGIVRLAYRYQFCEDWPDPLVLLSALKEAVWKKIK
ncbi:MAG: AhpC/TSA family protein [Anaerolineales bacterium]|nr:AhpC/TSA family protein [Anaerolineales bacterium]MBX3038427.1 AhpC/TSA family protein [Anaerolineales bacterium]